MSPCCSNTFKLSIMIVLVMLYFLVELVVGYVLNSIALVADAFHMLSDFLALIVGVAAHRVAKWPRSSSNTFGWQRAGVVGTQVNTVMLATLTFTIFIDCIKRFVEPVPINNPKLLLAVGSGGLLINIIGLLMLHDNHGHSHGGNVVEDIPDNVPTGSVINNLNEIEIKVEEQSVNHSHNHGHGKNHSHNRSRSAARMNTRAVFLHVLSDFFGSIAVVFVALLIWMVPDVTGNPKGDLWKHYLDPAISLVFVILIIIPTIPLLKKSTLILLQSVPNEVLVEELSAEIHKIEGIKQVHDLHVWLLHSDVIIGTVHIRCANGDFVETSIKVKKLFHDYNIHCTTIQTEPPNKYDQFNQDIDDECSLFCDDKYNIRASKRCNAKQLCCPTKKNEEIKVVIENDNPQICNAEATPPKDCQLSRV